MIMASKDKIKATLNKEVPHWDIDQVWENIEVALPSNERRRRPVFWLFWFMGLTILISGATFYVSGYEKENSISSHTTSITSEHAPIDRTNSSAKINQSTETIANNVINESAEIFINKNQILSQDTKTYSNQDLTYIKNIKRKQNKSNYPSDSQKKVTHVPSISNDNKEMILLNTDTILEVDSNSILSLTPLDFRIIPPLDGKLYFITYEYAIPYTNIYSQLPTKPIKTTWSFGLSSGISITKRHLDPKTSQYVNYRNIHEKPLETFSHDLEISYNYNRFIISTGLRLNRTTEWFTGQDITIERREIKSDSAFFHQNNGLTSYFSGNLKQTITSGTDIKSPNTLTRYYIPLSIGYQLPVAKNWHLHPYFGINFNFYTRYAGISVDETLQFIYKEANRFEDLYVAYGNHSFFTGINLEVYQNKDWTLFCGLRYQHDIFTVIRDLHNISQKYNTLGVNVGARYTFME